MSEEREGKIYMWFVVIFFIGVAFALIELVNRSYISVRQISTRELESVARLYLSDGSKVFSQHGGKSKRNTSLGFFDIHFECWIRCA